MGYKKSVPQPLFIAIDGIDGCGKSTQTRLLYDFFKEHNIECLLTKEPGGGLEETIRTLLLNPSVNVNAITETLLFFADRVEHMEKKIIPSIKQGISVISDRFIASTYAYQVFGRKVDLPFVDFLRINTINRLPDITVIIDIPTSVAMERTYKSCIRDESRFENMGSSFYKRVTSGFDWYLNNFDNVYKVDGNRHVSEVFTDIKGILSPLLSLDSEHF